MSTPVLTDRRISQMLANAKAETVSTPEYKLAMVCEALHTRLMDAETQIQYLIRATQRDQSIHQP